MKCFYHNDMDGRAAAAVVSLKRPTSAPEDFVAMDYGKPFPIDTIQPGEEVWIVDYSVEPGEMLQLVQIGAAVVWIDHHRTAIEKYADFPQAIPGLRRDGTAACLLTCEYLNPEVAPPRALELVGDRDVWAWKLGDDTRFFHAGALAEDTHPAGGFWYAVLLRTAPLEETIAKGRTVEAYRQNYYADYAEALAFTVEFAGHTNCLAMNVARVGSEAFGKGAIEAHDILIPFCHDGHQWTVSLYSNNVDVSEIAKARGGGGHKGAAGFQCDELPFKQARQ